MILIAQSIAHALAVALFLSAAWMLRKSAKAAFRAKLSPIEAIQTPLFFICLDIPYNLTIYRLVQEPALMLIGAMFHCICAVKVIHAVRSVKAWQ